MTRAQPNPSDTYVTDRPDVLELLGRLLVGSSYKVPVEGRGSKPGLQPADIAGAVGMMRDRLAREVALAVAQREPMLISAPRIVGMAYARVVYVIVRMRPSPLDLERPEDRHRLRMVIYDAAADLVWPERRQRSEVRAKAANMRKASYLAAHKAATAVLQSALVEARSMMRNRLFAE